jgi:hypothetical protein
MKVSTISLQPNLLRNGLAVAIAIGALTVMNARVHADELDPITLETPIVKNIRSDVLTELPAKDITVNADIKVDMETLRNDSGVVLLKDRVLEAAYKACNAADPLIGDDGECVHNAVKAAQPQVASIIARARAAVG